MNVPRKLGEGADLSVYDGPTVLGGPGEKRLKDFSVKSAAPKASPTTHKGMVKDDQDEGWGFYECFKILDRF